MQNNNYNFEKYDDEYQQLLNFLIVRLPKTIPGWNKKEFGFRIHYKTIYQLHNKKWVEYNQGWVNQLIIDIDNPEDTWDTITNKCLEMEIEPTWMCKTDKGFHLSFALEKSFPFENTRQIKYIRDIKVALTYFLNGDKNGSHKLKGIWRNPLQHPFFYNEELFYNLDDFKKILLDYREIERIENYKHLPINQIFKKEVDTKKKLNFIFTFSENERNEFLFRHLMFQSKNRNWDLKENINFLINLQIEENKKTNVPLLELSEIERIARSVLKYNKNNKNFSSNPNSINSNKTNKNYNIGSMGFDKIKNLSESEYIEEVKKRRSLSGKRTQELLKKDEGNKMTRIENCKKLNIEKEEKNYKKVVNLLTGVFNEEYKKKNGKWNGAKISRELKIDQRVVIKNIKKYEDDKN